MRIKSWLKNEVSETKELLKTVPATLMTFFVLSLVMMNLLANKSIDLGVDWLALDCGIVVSWIAFLTMDILVKCYGPKASTRLTIVATIINLLVSSIFLAASAIPGTWGEAFEAGEVVNVALDRTIGAQWYVLAGSTIAFVVSAVVNSVLNWLVGTMFKKDPDGFVAYAARSYVSTMVAQFVDNFVFSLIVSLNFFGWSIVQCITCAATGAVVELVCEIAFSPIGYKVAKNINKQVDGKDLDNNAKIDENKRLIDLLMQFTFTKATAYRDCSELYEKLPEADKCVYQVFSHNDNTDDANSSLYCDMTIMYPGKCGDEFNMTKGHIHLKPSKDEWYICIQGKGVLVEKAGSVVNYKPLKPMSIVHVKGNYAHRLVNKGDDKLVVLALYDKKAGHDYKAAKELPTVKD